MTDIRSVRMYPDIHPVTTGTGSSPPPTLRINDVKNGWMDQNYEHVDKYLKINVQCNVEVFLFTLQLLI